MLECETANTTCGTLQITLQRCVPLQQSHLNVYLKDLTEWFSKCTSF